MTKMTPKIAKMRPQKAKMRPKMAAGVTGTTAFFHVQNEWISDMKQRALSRQDEAQHGQDEA